MNLHLDPLNVLLAKAAATALIVGWLAAKAATVPPRMPRADLVLTGTASLCLFGTIGCVLAFVWRL